MPASRKSPAPPDIVPSEHIVLPDEGTSLCEPLPFERARVRATRPHSDVRLHLVDAVARCARWRRVLIEEDPTEGRHVRSHRALMDLIWHVRSLEADDRNLVALEILLRGRPVWVVSTEAVHAIRRYGWERPTPEPGAFLRVLTRVVTNSIVGMHVGWSDEEEAAPGA